MKHIFQSFFAVVGTVLTYLFGGWSAVIGILIAFVVLDYITGVLAAGSKGKLSSAVGMRGIARKSASLFWSQLPIWWTAPWVMAR